MSGVIRRSGIQVANLSRFQQFGLDLGASTPVTVVGSAGPDHLTLSSGAFDVDLAGGDDSVVVDHDGTVSGRLAAGRGEDGLVARFRSQLLKVHLDTGTFVADSTSLDAVGFERLEGGAPKIRVRGSNAANQISVVGCDVRVEGRGGRDDLNFGDVEELPDCTRTRTVLIGGKGSDLIDGSNGAERLRGGPGNDHLTGSAGKDVLIGGTGRDKTDGGKGKDRCQGEVRTSCET
jgi:Ca2+-binding RTX toxin-like protein